MRAWSVGVAIIVAVLGGCSSAPASTVPASGSLTPATPAQTASAASPSGPLSAEGWAEDLDALDSGVREHHKSPFTVTPEADWNERLAYIKPLLADASPDEQLVLLASLVGLLDTHTFLDTPTPTHKYALVLYGFDEGWFVIRAEDPSLVGSRLVSINGVPAVDVFDRLAPLVPHDNPTAQLSGVEWLISSVEHLHGAGIVSDTETPQFVLESADGDQVTVDPEVMNTTAWEQNFRITGNLVGADPEAVGRREQQIWTRLYPDEQTFLVAVNDYGDMTDATAEMQAALENGDADRVVLDMRYLRGGNGDMSILEALTSAPIDQPGVVTALIGRENESIATQVVFELDTQSEALLVGEPTPARANNFTCSCYEIVLLNSGYKVSVPLYKNYNIDERDAVNPDVSMPPTAADFFAGRDPVLDAALSGDLSEPD